VTATTHMDGVVMASPVAWRIVPAMEETLFDISDVRPWKRQPSYCSSLSPMRNFVAQSHPYHVTALGDVDKSYARRLRDLRYERCQQTLHRAKCVARMQ
jgi:hypothetical protein